MTTPTRRRCTTPPSASTSCPGPPNVPSANFNQTNQVWQKLACTWQANSVLPHVAFCFRIGRSWEQPFLRRGQMCHFNEHATSAPAEGTLHPLRFAKRCEPPSRAPRSQAWRAQWMRQLSAVSGPPLRPVEVAVDLEGHAKGHREAQQEDHEPSGERKRGSSKRGTS